MPKFYFVRMHEVHVIIFFKKPLNPEELDILEAAIKKKISYGLRIIGRVATHKPHDKISISLSPIHQTPEGYAKCKKTILKLLDKKGYTEAKE